MAAAPVVEGLRARRKRTRSALESTTLTTYEACLTEWLFSDNSVKTKDGEVVGDHMDLRGRFEHGISNAPGSDVLHMAKCLVEDVLSALATNSETGIAHIGEMFAYSRGLNTEYTRMFGALLAYEQTLTNTRAATPAQQLLCLKWRLRVFDDRFLRLPAEAEGVLCRVDLGTRGGNSKLSARGSLAVLIAMCRAFNCTTKQAATRKLERALATVSKMRALGSDGEKAR